jgi:hypothetical protein
MIIRKTQANGQKVEFTYDEELYAIVDTEIGLLTFLILTQLFKENRTTVDFDTFSQYPFEKSESITDDLGDFENVADCIYKRYFEVSPLAGIEDSSIPFLTINKITIDSEHFVAEIIKKAFKSFTADPQFEKDIASHYSGVIDLYFELIKECGFKKEYDSASHKFIYKFDVEPAKCHRYIIDLLDSAPKSVEISFIFKKDLAVEAEKKINEYLLLHHAKEDLTEFRDYILNLKFANGSLKLPFDAIANSTFNVIETLKYLDLTKQIEIQDWIGKNSQWEIRLLSKELLALFVPNIDLLIQINDSAPKDSGVNFTEDGKLEYEGKPTIFNLTPLQKALCKKLYSEKENYSFDTFDVEEAVYHVENNKKTQVNLKKLIERVNGKIRDKFGISKWIHYGTNSLRRSV